MIVVRNLEGRDAPQLLCDVCEQPITDGNMAAVVFKRSDESGEGATLHPLLYAHKGVCHRTAEQRLGGDEATGWIELYQHLLHLLKNCGLPAPELARLQGEHDRKFRDEDGSEWKL